MRQLLYYAESPVKWAMFRPVAEALAGSGDVRIHFAGTMRGRFRSREMARALGVERATPIPRGLAALKRFDAVVTSDYALWSTYERRIFPIRRSPRVQLFHGVSPRNGAIQEGMRRFDALFLVGPYMRRKFVESGIFAPDDPRLREVGMPKVDRLVRGGIDRTEVLEGLGLDPDKPTVVLAPTWIRRSPLFGWAERLPKALAGGPWNLVCKFHDKFFDPRFNLVDWRARLEELTRSPRVAAPVDVYDAVPLLAAADVLVSDLSSIAHEFCLLDRPIVYLGVEDLDAVRRQYPHLDVETWGWRTGDVVWSEREAVEAVERALAEPARHSEVRRAAARDLFYDPGRATERAAAELVRLMAGSTSRSHAAPAG